jgi:hypothetical protein
MTSAIKTVSLIGFWSAVLMTVMAFVSFGIGIATPPHSGPSCLSACIFYPFANAVSFFPRDYFWMVPGIFLTPLFVVLMACIHNSAGEDEKIFSLIGLSFALVSAAVITMDYFIQLTVMQPSLLQGEMDGLALFSQYNPHGIFIALEELGYLMLALAFFFAALVFTQVGRLEQSIRWVFIAGSLGTFVAFIALILLYGNGLEYRFEVTAITITWITLIVSGILLAILFRRREHSD